MKTFQAFMTEETNPFFLTDKGLQDIDIPAVRDNLNVLLNSITNNVYLTPYIALERVSKVLANYHVHLPKYTFSEGKHGYVAFEISQFGGKFGKNNDGETVTNPPTEYFVYFEYQYNDFGSFDIFCEVVDSEELEDLLSDEGEVEGPAFDGDQHHKTNKEEHGGHQYVTSADLKESILPFIKMRMDGLK